MTTISVDVDIDTGDFIGDIDAEDLIAELEARDAKGRLPAELTMRARMITGARELGERHLARLAEEIAAGETAEALATLNYLFPSINTANAIAYARRCAPGRVAA